MRVVYADRSLASLPSGDDSETCADAGDRDSEEGCAGPASCKHLQSVASHHKRNGHEGDETHIGVRGEAVGEGEEAGEGLQGAEAPSCCFNAAGGEKSSRRREGGVGAVEASSLSAEGVGMQMSTTCVPTATRDMWGACGRWLVPCTKFWDQHIHHYSLLPPPPSCSYLPSPSPSQRWRRTGTHRDQHCAQINSCAATGSTTARVRHLQQGEADARSSVLMQTQNLMAVAAEGVRKLDDARCKSPATASQAAGLLQMALQLTSTCCKGFCVNWRVMDGAQHRGANDLQAWARLQGVQQQLQLLGLQAALRQTQRCEGHAHTMSVT